MSEPTKLNWAGAWIVAVYKGFSEFNLYEPAFHDYEATILAARTAHLLSAIRKLGRVEEKELDVRRKLAKLKPSELPYVLEILSKTEQLDVAWRDSDRRSIEYIAALDTSSAWVFQATGSLFYSMEPTEQEQASLMALDLTAVIPLPIGVLCNEIARRSGFSVLAVSSGVEHLIDCGLLHRTREHEGGEPIVSNPYAFRTLGDDAESILSAVSQVDIDRALTILEHVKSKPGVPLPHSADKQTLRILIHAGLIDYSAIRVGGSAVSKEFPTIPHLWGVFETATSGTQLDKDLVDDAKLFLNSIRYGQFYSPPTRGQIRDPVVLVDRLVHRGEVGPASAIGSDYPLPLSRGIVSIVESRLYPGRYHMQLRKEDVARSVLEILAQGTVVGKAHDSAEELLSTTGQYQAPESLRIARKLPTKLQSVTDELAFELRSHRKNR